MGAVAGAIGFDFVAWMTFAAREMRLWRGGVKGLAKDLDLGLCL